MNCALRTILCAFATSFLILSHTSAVLAKSDKDRATAASNSDNAPVASVPEKFMWNEHPKLSWSDFRGPVNSRSEEAAAATHCGIGFKAVPGADGNLKIVVYNTFYTTRSWVRANADAKQPSVLTHEQGHFDLCEIYTRKLRARMTNFDLNTANAGAMLKSIYEDVSNEYQRRQQDYEDETTHGTDIPMQQRWTDNISRELSVANYASVN